MTVRSVRSVRRARTRARDASRAREDQTSERQLQTDVERLLRATGWLIYHTFDSRRSAPGFPDIVALRGSRLLVLELKREGAKPTTEQYEWLIAFATAGAHSYVVRPSNLDELAAIVSK